MEPAKGSEVEGLVVFHTARAVTEGAGVGRSETARDDFCSTAARAGLCGLVFCRVTKVAEKLISIEEISAAPIAVPYLIDQSYHLQKY